MIQKRKKGNAWVGILILLAFITSLGLALTMDSINTIAQSKKSAQVISAQALCDAGIEKAIWELNQNSNYTGTEIDDPLTMPTGEVDIIVGSGQESKNIEVTAYIPQKDGAKTERTVRAKIEAENNESTFAFHYGVQVGEYGVSMTANAQILGSVYSNGSVVGENGNIKVGGVDNITGDVFISGMGNALIKSKIGNDVHAHTIQSSYILGDAYYFSSSTLQGTTVIGNTYPNSETPEAVDQPISALEIEQWKSWAETGGTYSGDYTASGTESLGPMKIDGDFSMANGTIINLTGPLWVTGEIDFSNNATIKLDPSFGPNSTIILTDSLVDTSNNVTFQGSGDENSYIMVLSTLETTSHVNPSIAVGNNSDSVVYSAPYGWIAVSNNAHITALSSKGVRLRNNCVVEYESGLASANFSAGPGGSWKLKEWQVVH